MELLIIGLASQTLSLLIVISMAVAYLTADFEAVSNIFSDPDKFVKADPFPFLLTALIVLVFGPGRFSVDALLISDNRSALVVMLDQPGMRRGTAASTLDYLRKVADRKGISFYTHATFGLSAK
jgi:hypothetical protein